MVPDQVQSARIERLIAAFHQDGFQVVDPEVGKDVVLYHDKIGIRATHRTATIGTDPNNKKKAYYVEGDHYEMGYLMGQLAEPEIASMCKDFTKLVALAFVGSDIKKIRPLKWLAGLVLEVIAYWFAGNIYPDIPARYKRELEGVLEGCQAAAWAAGRETEVSWADLWVMNFGIDALLSFVYTGGSSPAATQPKQFRVQTVINKKARTLWELAPKHLSMPLMCNAFSVFGEDYHYFGRDFMFSSAGVFEKTACMVIQNPEPLQTPQGIEGGLPFVSMTAPGIIGSIAAMNIHGVGVGVDMAPSGNCNPGRAGFNSLLLARSSIENGCSCDEAVDIMAQSPRGVSWNYILADGTAQKACVVEAAAATPNLDPLAYPPDRLKACLPDRAFLETHPHPAAENKNGLMVRWNSYEYPQAYLDFNCKLFEACGKPYDAGQFTGSSPIGQPWKGTKCPSFHYFQPLGESKPNLVVATNSFIIPEMRLCAMYEWTALLAQSHADDIQWRYDELTRQLTSTLSKNNGHMSYDEAKKIIAFLAPDGEFPDYYNPKHQSLAELAIQGSVSLMDLKKKTMESHYGYYADEWVKISLPNYLASAGAPPPELGEGAGVRAD
jgi:hypothetical protein